VVGSEVEAMAGPKKKRLMDRRVYRWERAKRSSPSEGVG